MQESDTVASCRRRARRELCQGPPMAHQKVVLLLQQQTAHEPTTSDAIIDLQHGLRTTKMDLDRPCTVYCKLLFNVLSVPNSWKLFCRWHENNVKRACFICLHRSPYDFNQSGSTSINQSGIAYTDLDAITCLTDDRGVLS